MKLKTITILPKPKEGDTKEEKRFAWWPKKVEDKLIWLEYYKALYKFTVRKRIVFCQGFGVIDEVICGGWDLITEQLIKNA